MELTCPSCASRFRVRPELFSGGPRKVRCTRCSHVWLGSPEAPVELDEPYDDHGPADTYADDLPDPAPPDDHFEDDDPPPDPLQPDPLQSDTSQPDTLRADEELMPPLSAAARAMDEPRGARRRTPGWVWAGWLLLIVFVAGSLSIVALMPNQVTAAWPPAQRLYDMVEPYLDLQPEPPITLVIEKSSLEDAGGKSTMTLELRLENPGKGKRPIPVAAIDLIDTDGNHIRTVHVRIPGDPLAPGETRRIPLVLDDVPKRLDRVRAGVSDAGGQGG